MSGLARVFGGGRGRNRMRRFSVSMGARVWQAVFPPSSRTRGTSEGATSGIFLHAG